MGIRHPEPCACSAGPLRGRLDRRGFMRAASGGVAALALWPYFARAAEGDYEAMVLACIDPRIQAPVFEYLAKRKLTGQYSQFVIAGAAIGVVAPVFKDWHIAFWDNLAISIDLHRVRTVIAIDHRDCGAAKVAYGAEKVANPTIETATHRAALAEFRKEMAARQPHLAVETGLMALDGKMEMFG
jgi:carbonic anhydrase